MADCVRLLIADDHPVVRRGLRLLLEYDGRFQIVAEASSGEDAVAQALACQPDLAILDIRLPGLSGIDACRQIHDQVTGCRVLIHTAYAESELLVAAIRAGASGYILKRIGTNDLIKAVERVSQGENMLDPAMMAGVFDRLRNFSPAQEQQAFRGLTAREVAVLALISQGLTNRAIGLKLFLYHGTISSCVRQVFKKIGVTNRAAASAYATRHYLGL